MNRSTIYDFLLEDSGLEKQHWKIHNGNFPIFMMPYQWDHGFLIINETIRVSDFEIIILYSNELVVKFDKIENGRQINIKYRDIDSIEVREHIAIGYMKLENGERTKY